MAKKKKLVITIHGIKNGGPDPGSGTTDRIGKYLERFHNFEHREFDYGFVHVLGARFKNGNTARMLAWVMEEAVLEGYEHILVVGHSNGCAIMHEASYIMEERPFFKSTIAYIYMNPALENTRAPGKSIWYLDVWHTPYDQATQAAMWMRKLTPRFMRSKHRAWGNMGKVGYKGYPDKRIMNHNYQDHIDKKVGHSSAFKKGYAKVLFPIIIDFYLRELKQ